MKTSYMTIENGTRFYQSLTDEQKARFNSLRSISRPVG